MVASLHAHGYPSNQEGLLRMGKVAAAAGAACVEVKGALPTPGKSAARVLQLAREAQPLVDAATLLDMGLSPSSSASSAEAVAALTAGLKARSPVIQAYARSLDEDASALKALSTGLSLHEKEDKIKKVIDLLAEAHTNSPKKTHIYTSGIGKSGLVAARLASSLRSISIRSSHVPATDFVHGDMGSLARGDVLVCLSSSGKTNELIDATRRVRSRGVDVIAITRNPSSPLAQLADIHIHAKSTSELLGKIPSRSIVVNEAVSNAFVSGVAAATHFTVLDFLDNHPGGSIGAAASSSLASSASCTTSSSTGVVGPPPVSSTGAAAAATASSSSSSALPRP
eukprot:evm.model.NODE_24868_length_22975_cov_21.057629.4